MVGTTSSRQPRSEGGPACDTLNTPRRGGRSVNVDTEGRRSRFRSPPPPPGASPSLLLATPGRYAVDASSLIGCSGDPLVELQPLRPPVFTLKSSSAETGGEEKGSDGSLIRLHDWSISFVPVKTPVNISQSTSELTQWIIASGTRYRSEEYEHGQRELGQGEQWNSSLIFSRETSTHFWTASGSRYELVGPCNLHTACHKIGLPIEVAEQFRAGLPSGWVETVVQEAQRRGYEMGQDSAIRLRQGDASIDDRMPRKSSSQSPEYGPDHRKRRRRAVEGEEVAHLAETSSQESLAGQSARCSRRKRPRMQEGDLFTVSPTEAVSKTVKQQRSGGKGLSRELLQLQTSKLGNLTLVQVAIMEGLNTVGDVPKGKHSRETTLFASPIGKETSTTPLRASSRAKNATTEWWKVAQLAERKQKAVTKSLGTRRSDASPAVKAKAELSPAKSLDDEQDGSDASGSEDDYQCSSSSDGEREQPVEVRVSKRGTKRKGGKMSSAEASREGSSMSGVESLQEMPEAGLHERPRVRQALHETANVPSRLSESLIRPVSIPVQSPHTSMAMAEETAKSPEIASGEEAGHDDVVGTDHSQNEESSSPRNGEDAAAMETVPVKRGDALAGPLTSQAQASLDDDDGGDDDKVFYFSD